MQDAVLNPAPPGQGAVPPPPRRRRWLSPHWVALGIAVLLLGAGLNLQLPYDVFAPGEAPDAATFIKVGDPSKVQHHAGSIHLTTVGVSYGVRALQVLAAWLDPKSQVVSEKAFPQDTAAEVAAMDQSQRFAELAAFAELGDTNLVTDGALVTELRLNGPAAKFLHTGDVITGADGKPITNADQLSPVVLAHQAGETIHLAWQRANAGASSCPPSAQPMTGDVPVANNASPPPPRVIGIALQPDYVLPVPVCINAGEIQGPSAGLSWALAIVNLLGPRDLTRGRTIADTGTMDPTGAVGDIGGIEQKVYGAEAQHATLFVCPKDQAGDAQAAARKSHSSMKVVGVSTLHEAVLALEVP